ncbi:ComEC/Rec2 family competence protein [Streptomyces platensis]|uniref:ComEC/Rec2 family competence protein n=1 Tax=Streptomyces platensis TaxID=58346 RepID=UPI0022523033|nr:ComEC/Rec2 family competence protein [Streptomyces platensis]MCX4634347.1 ComEC/Rec2 family competence protein [Streptomyces platensis]
MTSPRATVHATATSPHGASDPHQEGPADLRLVAPALAAWAAAAIGLGVPGGGVAVACGVAVVLAVFALRGAVVRRRTERESGVEEQPGVAPLTDTGRRGAESPLRRSPRIRSVGALVALAAVLLCAAAGAASAALHASDLRRGPLPALAEQYARATVEVEVTGDPRLTRPKVRGSQRTPPVLVFTADAVRVTAPNGEITAVRTPSLVVVQQPGGGSGGAHRGIAAGWRELLPSTRIRVMARVAPPLLSGDQVAAVLRVTPDEPPHKVGAPDALQRLAGSLRAGLREATDGLRADARALLPGLVVGDTSRVPPDLDDAFRATDLTHLLAVSGSNLTIVLALLIGPPYLATRAERRGLAPRLGLSLRGTAVIGGALALAFVVVCRPDPSVLRAAACGLITLLAIGTGRRRSLLPALAAAVLLLVLYDPWLARSYGFLLSVLATGALLLLAPRWSAALQRRRVPPRLAEVLAAAAAAQAVCAPVVAVLAARVGLVAVPCNLLAELAVGPATVLGFAALALAPIVPPVAQALAWCAGWPAEWIAGVARTGAALPGAEFAWPGGWFGGLALAAAVVVMVPVSRWALRRRWLCVLCALAVILAVCRPAPFTRVLTGWPPPGWRAVVCDVGQGDGLVLAAGDGTALVVDTGPEPQAIDRCLTDLGVRRIPLLVLTHFHADHVDGLPGALRGRSVGAIETTTLQEPPGQAQFVRSTAAAARVPVIRAAPGERRHLGPLTWEVLWPPASPTLPGPSVPTNNLAALGASTRPHDAIHSGGSAGPAVPNSQGAGHGGGPYNPGKPGSPGGPGGPGTLGSADAPGGPGGPDIPGSPGAPTDSTVFDGPNDASVTLLVRTGGLTILLLGDLEPPAQQGLLAAHPELGGVDVLKVAHHGSAYQDPPLIQRLAPRLALISCGVDNPYGHPAPRTIAALRAQGARVLRTDTDGAIAILGTTAGLSATVTGHRVKMHLAGGPRIRGCRHPGVRRAGVRTAGRRRSRDCPHRTAHRHLICNFSGAPSRPPSPRKPPPRAASEPPHERPSEAGPEPPPPLPAPRSPHRPPRRPEKWRKDPEPGSVDSRL